MVAGFISKIFGIQDSFRLAGFALKDCLFGLVSDNVSREGLGLGKKFLLVRRNWKIWEELLLEWRSRNIIANYIALIAGAYKTYALFGARLRFLRELHVVNTAI